MVKLSPECKLTNETQSNRCNQFENEDDAMSLGKEMKVVPLRVPCCWGCSWQRQRWRWRRASPAPPPPPGPGMMLSMHGPGGGAFFHEEIGDGPKVVTGAPMTVVIDSHTRQHAVRMATPSTRDNQSTVYRDSQGRVRREVRFRVHATPTHGRHQGHDDHHHGPGCRHAVRPESAEQDGPPDAACIRRNRPTGAAEGEPPAKPLMPTSRRSILEARRSWDWRRRERV